jgi:hypothetical protein
MALVLTLKLEVLSAPSSDLLLLRLYAHAATNEEVIRIDHRCDDDYESC